jgi:MFS transporter, putative metabolite:H+ symporter
MALEELINGRVGLGVFHLRTFLLLCLVDMNDGVELVLSSFLNPIIRGLFPHATPATLELLASIFYAGILLGSLTSGFLADRHGRKRLITSGAILQICVSAVFYLADSLEDMVVLRFLYGFSFGFTVAVTTSMFAEVSPSGCRGKGILLINFCISIGKLYAVFLGWLFLQPVLADTNWKLMMVCGALPNFIVLWGSIYILEESPRFLLLHQQLDAGIDVLKRMLQQNGKAPMTPTEEREIRGEF